MQHHHMDKDDGNSTHHEVRGNFLAACKQIKILAFPLDCKKIHGCHTRNTDVSTKEELQK